MNVTNNAVVDYWHDYYVVNNLCSLCGNTGFIDTRAMARTTAGFYCGAVNFCICPNGQMIRGSSTTTAQIMFEEYQKRTNDHIR